MTPARHYAEAARLAACIAQDAAEIFGQRPSAERFQAHEETAAWVLPLAQVHATLALAAAQHIANLTQGEPDAAQAVAAADMWREGWS